MRVTLVILMNLNGQLIKTRNFKSAIKPIKMSVRVLADFLGANERLPAMSGRVVGESGLATWLMREMATSRKKRRLVDDSEEEEGGDDALVDTEEEEGEEEEDDDWLVPDSDDGSEEEEEEEGDSSPSFYHRVNQGLVVAEEERNAGVVMPVRPTFEPLQAFTLYLRRLKRLDVAPTRAEESAVASVEGLVCVRRESLLASSAWRPAFLAQLCAFPVMAMHGLTECEGDRCDACGRCRSLAYRMRVGFRGLAYDSSAMWRRTSLALLAQKEPATELELSQHCANRASLYHALLHYKFHLVGRVHAVKSGSITAAFAKREHDKLLALLDRADNAWRREG
jgi:hypothetical protein